MPAVVQLINLSLSVGSTQLLDGVAACVSEGQRVALVGPNGCGKSTLLRALSHSTTTAAAEDNGGDSDYYLVGAGGVVVSLDPDEVLLVEQDDLQWSRLLPTACEEEDELRQMTVEEALDAAAAGCHSGASADLDGALEDVEAWRSLSVATHGTLGWGTAGYSTTSIAQLSPGSAMRAYLAVALRRRDVRLLLLDEPTNHLDLPSILWLQETVRAATDKTVVLVSHDGAFLDAVADHVWDIDPLKHSITVSGAAFSSFQHAKEAAREQQRAAYDSQQKRNKRLTAVADKLRAASASGQRHQAKDNDKLQRDFRRDRAGRSGRKAKAVETLRDSEAVVERVLDRLPLRIELDFVDAGTDSSIMLGGAVLGYPLSPPLPIPPVSLRIDFGERVAIVGYNGVGKSTLLRTITRQIPPLEADSVSIGRELHFGNLTQEHESLPRDVTPRQYFSKLTAIPPFETGSRLIRYGLSRQQVDCLIGELNPGARARSLLAGFSLRKVNVLILDEPTNHLDTEAMAEVTGTLNEYKGTVIVVSHSRWFLEALHLTRLLWLTPTGLKEIGSFEEFASITEDTVREVISRG